MCYDRQAYVEAVTGSVQPRNCKDMAQYLYSFVHRLDTIIDFLKSDSPYQWKLAREQLVNFQESLLINAKYYEGLPVQQKLF